MQNFPKMYPQHSILIKWHQEEATPASPAAYKHNFRLHVLHRPLKTLSRSGIGSVELLYVGMISVTTTLGTPHSPIRQSTCWKPPTYGTGGTHSSGMNAIRWDICTNSFPTQSWQTWVTAEISDSSAPPVCCETLLTGKRDDGWEHLHCAGNIHQEARTQVRNLLASDSTWKKKERPRSNSFPW